LRTFLKKLEKLFVGSDAGLESVAGLMGKLPKRLQSVFSPRDFSSDADQIENLVAGGILDRSVADPTGRTGINYLYDDVEAILRTAGGDYQNLSFAEKVLIRKTIEEASPISRSPLRLVGRRRPVRRTSGRAGRGHTRATTGSLTFGLPPAKLSTSLFVPKEASSAADAAFESIEKSLQLRDAIQSADGTIDYLDGMGDLSQRLRTMITEAVEKQRRIAADIEAGVPGVTPKSMLKILKEEADRLEPDDPVRELVGKLKPAIEAARDGHYLLVKNVSQEILNQKITALNALKAGSFIDEDVARNIDQLQR